MRSKQTDSYHERSIVMSREIPETRMPALLLVFLVLQRVVAFLARSDLNYVFDVVDEYFPVAHVAGVQRLFYRIHHRLGRNPADDDIDLHLRKRAYLDRCAAVIFRVPFLHAVTEDIGDRQAGDADFVKRVLQPCEFSWLVMIVTLVILTPGRALFTIGTATSGAPRRVLPPVN